MKRKRMDSSHEKEYIIFSGQCPDEKCQSRLYYMSEEEFIYCTCCGQTHESKNIKNAQLSTNTNKVQQIMEKIWQIEMVPKRRADTIKVRGLSNYHAKLISPFLTTYGMDKKTGLGKRLSDLNQGEYFDCSLLRNRSFLIDSEHLAIAGYGRDTTGSHLYLKGLLDLIRKFNSGVENLIPIHSDTDGHCLVHAISRSLVGRELFWHPLRCHLKRHFESHLMSYKKLFNEFVDENDWEAIIDECDPEHIPKNEDILGLRNIHIFGLANVLKRPIILLDALERIESSGDYAGIFLPSLVPPIECQNKDGTLNRPLCIAWNSTAHNHYIPLVGLSKGTLPRIPRGLMPKAWGVCQSSVDQYIEFDAEGGCEIGGRQTLGESYILKLTDAINKVFTYQKGVHPSIVEEYHLFSNSTQVFEFPSKVIATECRKLVFEGRLYRCSYCHYLQIFNVDKETLESGGPFNVLVKTLHKDTLKDGEIFFAPTLECKIIYNAETDDFIPIECLSFCKICRSQSLRKVNPDGTMHYQNMDSTKTISTVNSTGFKFYWEGEEYDHLPQKIQVGLDWSGSVLTEELYWFQDESDPSKNSNAFQLASQIVQKHYPGVFGSERLIQRVVEQIFSKIKAATPTTSTHLVNQPWAEPSNKPLLKPRDFKKKIKAKPAESTATYSKKDIQESIKAEKQSTEAPIKLEKQEVASVEASESPQPISPVKKEIEKFVKVVTSDGRQGQLYFQNVQYKFTQLQEWIEKEFDIPSSKQKIKQGFPPQELKPSDEYLDFKHGDRLMVEIVEKKGLVNNSVDELENGLHTAQRAARESNMTLWNFVKNCPGHFQKNGIYYRLAKRQKNLAWNDHCNLPLLESKNFRFNNVTDSVELCVQSYNHHIHLPINKDVDRLATLKISQLKKKQSSFNHNRTRYGPGYSVLEGIKQDDDRAEQLRKLLYNLEQAAKKND